MVRSSHQLLAVTDAHIITGSFYMRRRRPRPYLRRQPAGSPSPTCASGPWSTSHRSAPTGAPPKPARLLGALAVPHAQGSVRTAVTCARPSRPPHQACRGQRAPSFGATMRPSTRPGAAALRGYAGPLRLCHTIRGARRPGGSGGGIRVERRAAVPRGLYRAVEPADTPGQHRSRASGGGSSVLAARLPATGHALEPAAGRSCSSCGSASWSSRSPSPHRHQRRSGRDRGDPRAARRPLKAITSNELSPAAGRTHTRSASRP
jgi:hypothetical protein